MTDNPFKDTRAHAPMPRSNKWYVLAVLTLVYSLSIADRFVMSTLIEPIKAELQLSDSAVGFLTGVSLALFYVTAGLPLAALADKTNRRSMISLALGAWSLMTALCGLATNFIQLMLARIGVGIGEAGGTPPSTSLVSDYFPWQRRPLALSIYAVGASLGSMLGSSAGYASDAWGWRGAFLVLGIPGLLFALIVRFTVHEPERGTLDVLEGGKAGVLDTLRFIGTQPAMVHALLGAAVFTLWAWGLMWWTPSFLVRSHHMSLGDAGGSLSLIHGIGGTLVLVGTTLLMNWLATLGVRAIPWFVAGVIAVATIPSIIAYATADQGLSTRMLWVYISLSYASMGPTFALVQNLVSSTMRAQATAFLLFFANIANLVVAPQLIGFLSDYWNPAYGAESLRHALIPLACTGFWAAFHYWRCGCHLSEGLKRAGNAGIAPG